MLLFCINKDEALTEELLQKMIQRFRLEVEPKLRLYKDYEEGKHAILRKTYSDASKPCSRTVVNYCANIANSYVGYIGRISYSSEEDIADIMDILLYNDVQAEDMAFLRQALVYGTAAELMYNDAQSRTRFKLIDPCSCFGVYDDSLSGDLLYFVRMYRQSEWNDSDIYNVDLYSAYDIKHYEMHGRNGYLRLLGEEPHYFAQCPANIFTLPDEKSIFDCVLTLQDAVNELLSSEIDDFAQFCDAYLGITGADMDANAVQAMKESRVLLLPEGSTAQWLTKSASDTQVENILKRLHDSIYRISQCVDFSNENLMSGVASGISIQYKMCGQESRAAMVETIMRKALQRRIEILCGQASLRLGEEYWREINITFKRNIPEDITTSINIVNGLRGAVSDETLLSQVPFITDPQAEIEALQEQKAANMALYNFGSHTHVEAEEDE